MPMIVVAQQQEQASSRARLSSSDRSKLTKLTGVVVRRIGSAKERHWIFDVPFNSAVINVLKNKRCVLWSVRGIDSSSGLLIDCTAFEGAVFLAQRALVGDGEQCQPPFFGNTTVTTTTTTTMVGQQQHEDDDGNLDHFEMDQYNQDYKPEASSNETQNLKKEGEEDDQYYYHDGAAVNGVDNPYACGGFDETNGYDTGCGSKLQVEKEEGGGGAGSLLCCREKKKEDNPNNNNNNMIVASVRQIAKQLCNVKTAIENDEILIPEHAFVRVDGLFKGGAIVSFRVGL